MKFYAWKTSMFEKEFLRVVSYSDAFDVYLTALITADKWPSAANLPKLPLPYSEFEYWW